MIESLVLPLLSVLIPLAMWWWSRGSSTYIRQEDEDTEEDTRNEERDVESAAPGGRPRDPSIPLPPIVVRKLERPGETLSANESIECLISCIEFGVAQAECAKGRELVIIIGNTGAGKSTFVNMLEGCELERVTKEEACVVVEGGAGAEDEIVRVKPGSKPAEVMKIGHTKESMTFMPEVEPASSLGTGFSYADCPGFLDNRGFEINVANAVNIKQTITSAASVRAIVLINYQSLLADRGRGVRELCQILADLFGGRAGLVAHRGSVLVGISQAPSQVVRKGKPHAVSAKAVADKLLCTDGLPADTAELIGGLAGSVFIFDPCGEGDASWLKRPEIVRRIKGLTPIADAQSIFRTVLVPEDESGLRRVVEDLGKRIRVAMDGGAYQSAAQMLVQLRRIDRVDNVVCTRLLKTVEEHVDASLRAMEKEVLANAMRGDIVAATSALETALAPAARALQPLRGAKVMTELVASVRAMIEQRQKESVTLAEATEALKEAREDLSKHRGLVQALTQQAEATKIRLAKLDSEKLLGEETLRTSEASTREAFVAEQQRLQVRMDALSATEEKERQTLLQQRAMLEAELRKQLEEQQTQAERDKVAQQALIDASRQQQEELTRQLTEARGQLGVQQKAVELRAALGSGDTDTIRAALKSARDAPSVDARLIHEAEGRLQEMVRRQEAHTKLERQLVASPVDVAKLAAAIGEAREAQVDAAVLEAAKAQMEKAEKAAAERVAQERVAQERAAADRVAQERAAAERVTQERVAQEKEVMQATEKAAAERTTQEKAMTDAAAANFWLKMGTTEAAARKATHLDLRGKSIGSMGGVLLAGMVKINASVTCLDVRGNNISGDGASQLSAAVLGNPQMEKFNEIPIKEMRTDSLTELDLRDTHVGVVGGMVVAGLMPVMASLSSINLYNNRIGSAGAKVLAPAIRDSASLTSVDLSNNNLGDGETGYVKARDVQGSSFNVGDKVVYQRREMVVSKGKDSDGDIKMKPAVADLSGIKAIADALGVSPSVTSVRALGNSWSSRE